MPLTEKPEEVWLPEVGKGIQLQLVIYGRKLSKVPLKTYQLRVAYATPRSGFWKVLRKTTGKEIIADDPLGPNLDGAFVGAIVSEPVTIKIMDASRPK